jgi:CRP-like cAMP-binding protein
MTSTVKGKLDKFFTSYHSKKFTKGDILLTPTEEIEGIFYLTNGLVRQFTTSSKGSELTINFLSPGAFFPISWVINQTRDHYIYEAWTDGEGYLAPSSKVMSFLKSQPDIVLDLTSRLLQANAGLTKRIESLAFGSASQRLISILLYLAKHFGQKTPSGEVALPHFTHESLAQLAALSRERTSLIMEKLTSKGLVKYHHNREINLVKLDDLVSLLNKGASL